MPPEPTAEGAVSIDTTISWKSVPNAAAYIIRWRPTDTADWEHSLRPPGTATNHALEGVRVDDWVFGVSSVSADGYASPGAVAVPGGACKTWPPPPAESPRRPRNASAPRD